LGEVHQPNLMLAIFNSFIKLWATSNSFPHSWAIQNSSIESLVQLGLSAEL